MTKSADVWRLVLTRGAVIAAAMLVLLIPSRICWGTQSAIRLGATISLEGSSADLSSIVQKGYELWAKEVNERGGILGRRVELIFYNDKGNPKLVGHLYRKLIVDDQVDMLLSPCGADVTPAAEVAENYNFVMLAAAASSEGFWNKGYRYVFAVSSPAERYFSGFLDLAAGRKGKNVGIVFSNTPFNVSVASGAKTWAARFGLKVAFAESFSDYRKDLPEIVKKMQAGGVEHLIFSGYPAETYYFLELLQAEKFRPSGLALAHVSSSPDFYASVGNFAEDIFAPSLWVADGRLPFPGVKRFIQGFIELTGTEPSSPASSAYAAGQIIERALLQAGDIDQEKIRDSIAKLDTITIMGRFKVDKAGRQVGHNAILVQWQGGIREIVHPTKMRTAKSRFGEDEAVAR